MAKKRGIGTSGKAPKSIGELGPVVDMRSEAGKSTFTTRFDERQRECVEAAARACGVTAGEFVRNAAVRRAVECVNARGEGRGRLRALASIMVTQMQNPSVRIERVEGELPDQVVIKETVSLLQAKHQAHDLIDAPDWVHEGASIFAQAIEPCRPHDADLEEIASALRTCGSEFADMLAEAWGFGDRRAYKPKVDASNLLSEGASE